MTSPLDLSDETAWPDADLDSLRIAVLTEIERRQTLAAGPAQIESLAARYQQALGDNPNPTPWTGGTDPTVLYGPGATVTYQGATYRNGTGGTLNAGYIPGDTAHPFWTLIPAGGTAVPWAAGMTLVHGAYVTYGGQVWQYQGADTANMPANWAPAANATWTLIGPAT